MQEIRLLLVDKNLSYLEVAKKMLKFHNEEFVIHVATTGEECFEKLLNNHYDLVLLDYDVDDKKGLDVLNKIIRSGFDLTVVMMVEEGHEDMAFKALEQGAADYIMKVRGYLTALPFTVTKVLELQKSKNAKTIKSVTDAVPAFKTASTPGKEAFFILDRQGRFLSSNRLLEKMSEYSEAELLELNFSDLIPNEKEPHYTQWLSAVDMGHAGHAFKMEIVGKYGHRRIAEIYLNPMKDRDSEITSYKGKIIFDENLKIEDNISKNTFNQNHMVQMMVNIINSCHHDSLNQLLERITKTICQLFQFRRATLALLDRRRKVFVKLIMVGYSIDHHNNNRILEVPQDVIERAFNDSNRIKVLYFDQNATVETNALIESIAEERRSQPRRINGKWHPNDMVIVNLLDRHQQTFGYISLANPEFDYAPSHEIFHNLEIFSNLASLAIETYYRIATIEKRNRRLKQLLVTSNIFKLHLNLTDMMNEVVWSIKFSLDFNLVMLALISKKSGKLEVKSVACDDKIKTLQIKELHFSIDSFKQIFRKQYRRSRSYFLFQEEAILKELKNIYYATKVNAEGERYWPWWSLLVIPIFRRENKIVGFLMVDDPADCLIPSKETIHTLEILTTQISVAIDNRLTFLQSRENVITDKNVFLMENESSDRGLKKLVDKVFK